MHRYPYPSQPSLQDKKAGMGGHAQLFPPKPGGISHHPSFHFLLIVGYAWRADDGDDLTMLILCCERRWALHCMCSLDGLWRDVGCVAAVKKKEGKKE